MHHIQLLHTIPSKLSIVADYEHMNNNAICLLCTLNSSWSASPSIASSLLVSV